MYRRTFIKGGVAMVGAASLAHKSFAQAAPSSIRVGYAISLSGPFAPGAEFDELVAIQAMGQGRQRRRRPVSQEVRQEDSGRTDRL